MLVNLRAYRVTNKYLLFIVRDFSYLTFQQQHLCLGQFQKRSSHPPTPGQTPRHLTF